MVEWSGGGGDKICPLSIPWPKLFGFYFRVVANYITWTIIHEYGSYLSSEFHDTYLEYARQAYGIKKSSELWRRCVRGTDKSIDMGVSMLYVTDKESGVTNQSLHRVSITKCRRFVLKVSCQLQVW